jgi:hypothetical protein
VGIMRKKISANERYYIPPISIDSLPKETDNSIFLEKIIGTNSKEFFY